MIHSQVLLLLLLMLLHLLMLKVVVLNQWNFNHVLLEHNLMIVLLLVMLIHDVLLIHVFEILNTQFDDIHPIMQKVAMLYQDEHELLKVTTLFLLLPPNAHKELHDMLNHLAINAHDSNNRIGTIYIKMFHLTHISHTYNASPSLQLKDGLK